MAAAILAAIAAMIRGGVRSPNAYLLASLAFWVAMLGSGVHATLAGVILGAMTPIRPWFSLYSFERSAGKLLRRFRRALGVGDFDRAEAIMGQVEELSRGTESQLDRRLRQVHPWSSYVVLPAVRAGELGGGADRRVAGAGPASSGITWGILLGLVVGKPLGIVGFAWLAVEAPGRLAARGGDLVARLAGVGMVAGIGFTVSLFVTGLAFDDPRQVADAKIGVLVASALAGALGFAFLRTRGRPGRRRAGRGPAGRRRSWPECSPPVLEMVRGSTISSPIRPSASRSTRVSTSRARARLSSWRTRSRVRSRFSPISRRVIGA